MSGDFRYILIADPDPAFAGTLQTDPETRSIPPLVVSTVSHAQRVIGDRRIHLAGIFVNPSLHDPDYIQVILSAYRHRPTVPLHLILEQGSAQRLSEDQLVRLGVRRMTKSGALDYGSMIQMVAPFAMSFDSRKALELAKANRDQAGQTTTVKDTEFVSIGAEDFLSGVKSIFDIYLRLRPGKYLKLLNSGDVFDSERIFNYISKGVTHFHIRKEVQSSYVEYCNHLVTRLMKKEEVPLDFKVSQVLNLGEEVIRLIQGQGIDNTNLMYASMVVGNARNLVKEIRNRQGPEFLTKLIPTVAAYDHASGTTLLSTMLAAEVDPMLRKSIHLVGHAAFLHEIGMYSLPQELWHGDLRKMTSEEQALFVSHPERGYQSLRELKRFDQVSLLAVLGHHTRVDGSGFPAWKSPGPVPKVTQIVGLADEYHHLLQRSALNPALDVLEELNEKVFPGFSRGVVQAFLRVFFPRARANPASEAA